MTGHPLDPEPLDPAMGTSKSLDVGAWGDQTVDEAPIPERPLLRPSVILLVVGGAVAFLAGVAASNSAPNSTGEIVGSGMNRVGVLLMLLACCGIMFAYRYTYLRDLLTGAKHQRLYDIEILNIVLFNVGLILVCGGFLFALSMLPGNWVLLPAAALFCIHLSISMTMIFNHTGAWRAYGIGVATTILFVFAGGMMNYMWAFAVPQVLTGTGRSRGGSIPIWPVVLFHVFVVVNGIICAGYVSWLTFIRSAQEKSQLSNSSSKQEASSERDD